MAKKGFFVCIGKNCSKEIETMIPDKKDVGQDKPYFDSAFVCPHCGFMGFKKVYVSGRVGIIELK